MRVLAPAAALALAACSHARPPPAPAPVPVQAPLVAFEAVKVEGLGFAGANLLFRGRIENPNATALSVARVEYALALAGAPAARGTVEAPVAVPAAEAGGPGLGSVDLPVQLRYAAVPGVARTLAEDREAEYALGGAVVFATPGGEVRVPIAASGRMPVPRAPGFRVEKVLLRSASPREVSLEMRVDVTNRNAFDLPAGRLGCGLHLSNREVVRADVEFAQPIAAGATASVVVPIRISVFKAGKAVARLLIPFTSVDVAVKGEAVFGGVPVPLDLATSILPGS